MVKIAEATPEPPRKPYQPQIAHRLPFEQQSPFPSREGAIKPYYWHPPIENIILTIKASWLIMGLSSSSAMVGKIFLFLLSLQ